MMTTEQTLARALSAAADYITQVVHRLPGNWLLRKYYFPFIEVIKYNTLFVCLSIYTLCYQPLLLLQTLVLLLASTEFFQQNSIEKRVLSNICES
jgi:hypothetical protein